MIVVLIGYMASGKSIVGKHLASLLNFNYIDLDLYIENQEGQSINDIFETKGEIYFRKQESLYLNSLLESGTKTVLALGGGTPCYGSNIDLIKSNVNTTSIYLKATITTLVDRLKNETDNRPLVKRLSDETLLSEFIGKHLFERRFYYEQAEHTINTDNKSVNQISEEIVAKLF